MAAQGNSQISFSFMELRQLLKSFDFLESGKELSSYEESAIYHLVDHLGDVALPVLLRKLFTSQESGRWASLLLLRLAQDDAQKIRISSCLREHAASPYLQDRYKLLCSSLLATLSGYQEQLPELALPEECAELSLVELAECMSSRAEVARAVDILMTDLPSLELIEFVEDFGEHQPESAHLMLSELMLREDLDGHTRTRLRQIRVSVPKQGPEISSAPPRRPGLRIGRHENGRTGLVCYAKIPSQSPARYRAVCFVADSEFTLLDCQYLETATRSEIDRQLLSPLATHGYELSRISQADAKAHVVKALRARKKAGRGLPSDYYLGRDLLGIVGEHCQIEGEQSANRAALLARGTELMNRNKLDIARELLVRYAQERPDDSEAMATLGACLLKRGELERARAHLARAAWLSPQVGRHHWNGASLAHQEGRLGDCFVALQQYLRCVDTVDSKQRHLAEAFVADYSRRATLGDDKQKGAPASSPRPRPRLVEN